MGLLCCVSALELKGCSRAFEEVVIGRCIANFDETWLEAASYVCGSLRCLEECVDALARLSPQDKAVTSQIYASAW